MKNLKLSYLSVLLLLTVLVFGCNRNEDEPISPQAKTVKDFSADVSHEYYAHYLSIIKHTEGYRPPVSARALAYIGLAAYEAAAPGMTKHQSIASNFPTLDVPKINSSQTYHWGATANAAYQYALRYFIQNMDEKDYKKNDSIANAYDKKYAAECDTATFNRSKRFGQAVSYAVYIYSLEDGQANAYRNNKPTDFIPAVGLGLWERTPPDYLNGLTPRWGSVRTFFVRNEDKQLKAPPATFSMEKTSDFHKQAKEVYDAVKNITTESKWIAEFWNDDLHTYTIDAAGRWISIANGFMKQQKSDLETAIYINTKIGISLHDASVVCWNAKYHFNILRPVTYINNYIDKDWRPILRDLTKPVGQQIGVTPQHPSYPSGHSVFGAVTASIMKDEFGDNINFTDRTHERETYFDGRPRTFKSFTEMSNENAFSRIPLGVHYRMDCEEGIRLGEIVGQRINNSNWKKTLQ